MSAKELKLLRRSEWKNLTCEEQIREQVMLRTALQAQMVGSLYPCILDSEIHDLLGLIKELPR